MNIFKVVIEYKVVRHVEIITEHDLTDDEITSDAYIADTEITRDMNASLITLRRVLKASEYRIVEIVRESDDFGMEEGKAVVRKLTNEKCLAPDGRLGTYPKWLSVNLIDRMIVLGLFQRVFGGPETMNHVDYYLVDGWESK
jgi:hypothetical protein